MSHNGFYFICDQPQQRLRDYPDVNCHLYLVVLFGWQINFCNAQNNVIYGQKWANSVIIQVHK